MSEGILGVMTELAGNQIGLREPFCHGSRERRDLEAHCVLCAGLALYEEQPDGARAAQIK